MPEMENAAQNMIRKTSKHMRIYCRQIYKQWLQKETRLFIKLKHRQTYHAHIYIKTIIL